MLKHTYLDLIQPVSFKRTLCLILLESFFSNQYVASRFDCFHKLTWSLEMVLTKLKGYQLTWLLGE